MDHQRQCNECTECCKGWLTANIYGKEMMPGRPCHFLAKNSCSIYKDRPTDPCVNYTCMWLNNMEIPEWLKPSVSKVIMSWKRYSGGNYLEVKECGEKMDSTVLNWIYIYAGQNNFNLAIEVAGSWYFRGPPEFTEEISNTKR